MLFRNGQGNIKCHLLEATHTPQAYATDGYGGSNGLGSLGCTSQYTAIGTDCIALPPYPQNQQSNAFDKCVEEGGILLNPTGKVQNEIIGTLMDDLVT